jgi:DNA-binding transcriptional MerR regulator
MNEQHFTISQLAGEFGITTRAIRFYEEKGLISPRRSGQQRLYSAADRVRLKLILRGKRLGFTLEESRDLIDMYDPRHGNVEQLQRLLQKIEDKEALLQRQLRDIAGMQRDLDEVRQRCKQALQTQYKQAGNG